MNTQFTHTDLYRRVSARPALARYRNSDGMRLERIASVLLTTDTFTGTIQWVVSIDHDSDDRPCESEYWAHYPMDSYVNAREDAMAVARHYGFRCRFATALAGWRWIDPHLPVVHPVDLILASGR